MDQSLQVLASFPTFKNCKYYLFHQVVAFQSNLRHFTRTKTTSQAASFYFKMSFKDYDGDSNYWMDSFSSNFLWFVVMTHFHVMTGCLMIISWVERCHLPWEHSRFVVPFWSKFFHKSQGLPYLYHSICGCIDLKIQARLILEFMFSFFLSLCSLANNGGLCGVGIRNCHKVSGAAKVGIGFAIAFGIVAFFVGGYLCWKRRQNIARGAQRLRKYRFTLHFFGLH
jgi:hypothetical protein